MKNSLKICAMVAMLAISYPAMAEHADTAHGTPAKEGSGGMMNCPMMGDMDKMQKGMSSMMQDMDSMMGSMSDPAMKERMQKMRDHMGSMMSDMQKMNGMMDMMGKGMQGSDEKTQAPSENPAEKAKASDEADHKAHHPAQ